MGFNKERPQFKPYFEIKGLFRDGAYFKYLHQSKGLIARGFGYLHFLNLTYAAYLLKIFAIIVDISKPIQ